MSTTSLIGNYISHDQKIEIIKKLAKQLNESNENVDVLVEFLHNVQPDSDTFKLIESYCQDHLLDEEYNEQIYKLLSALPELESKAIEKITSLTQNYIDNHRVQFENDYYQLFHLNAQKSDQEVSDEDISSLFSLLDIIFKNGKQEVIIHMDKLILLLLGSDEDVVSKAASNLLRWRINLLSNDADAFDLCWDVIFFLVDSKDSLKQYHGYVLWLRYINSSENLKENQKFQTILDQNIYWGKIQSILGDKCHELRKYGMFILQMSIKSINSNVQNDFIKWDTTKSQDYINEWERYVTLYEVLAIDTSLHQAKAGMNDITNLISPQSLILPSWGWCLLSTGFQAPNDSVRKFTMSMLLSIPSINLYLVKDALQVLEKTLLPNLINAPNFDVKTLNGIVECPYAYKLKDTIKNMVINLDDQEDLQNISSTILGYLASHGHNFGPSRILVLHGVLEGLNGRKVLQYGVHDQYLSSIFESSCEGGVLETYFQTVSLRLILNFEPELKNSLALLDKFCKFNGLKVLKDNITLFEEVTKAEPVDEVMKQDGNVDQKILLLGITTQIMYLPETDSLLIAKLLESGFRKATLKANEDRLRMLVNSNDPEVIETLSNVDYEKFTFAVPSNDAISKLWSEIEVDLQSGNIEILERSYYKYRLFNKLYKHSSFEFINPKHVIDFHSKLLANTEDITKQDRFFYKLKSKIDGEYYNSLRIQFEKHPTDFDDEFKILNPNTSSYEANLAMVALINNYLSSEKFVPNNVSQIVLLLSEMWSNVVESRLLLNQQDLHLSTIKTMLNSNIIFNLDSDHEIKKFCQSVIENSATRRCFLPTLISSLVKAQLNDQEKFEQLNWLPEVLTNASLVRSSLGSYFLLIGIMSQIFDDEVALDKNTNIYKEVYGDEEISARINLSAIVNSIQSPVFSQRIYNYIIDNQAQYRFFQPLKWNDHNEEWDRLQLYTILTSIIDKVDIDFNLIKERLNKEQSPLVRMYIEWMISYNMFKSQKYMDALIEDLKVNSNSLKPAVVTSYIRALFLAVVQLDKDLKVKYLLELINFVITGCSSSRKMIRHFSLSLIISIRNEIKKKNSDVDSNVQGIVENMYESAINSDNFKHFRSGDALLWDIIKDLNLVSLNGGIVLRLTDREDIDFINEEQFKQYLSDEQIKLLRHPIGNDETDIWIKEKLNEKKVIMTQADPVNQIPLQTKSGALTTVDNDLDIISSKKEVNRSDLIVVSSLVDKPPNLGGICRLCDVLGAGLLTLHDLEVKNEQPFKSVAVTADQWMPMIEVKPEDIKNYLQEKKKEGYTLIGLEQTDKSIVLNSELKFPKKSLMLLGKEREGIPGELLAELDFCVEIKQVGIVRSMNIQTATAVLVHAYSSQHC
ncbi:hypothetical protein KGF54_001837 [Candida jiufengensis]|uniref:uncharacterized protein n=1 Tax=Candida jiufengensis TaxID=497108 RepID=UPI002223EF82|nr:uncharacterized protein KGF54_001837 [Candida jiufengensis]KAI5955276.1 hypothetical protein KGF54_001837 [Candida jiufengensis]